MKGETTRAELVRAIQNFSESDNLIVASFIAGMRTGEKLGEEITVDFQPQKTPDMPK